MESVINPELDKVFLEAQNAGEAAAAQLVEPGILGYAHVVIRKANSPFGLYLKRRGLGRKLAGPGWSYAAPLYDSNLAKRQAFASAFCAHLKKYGIECDPFSCHL